MNPKNDYIMQSIVPEVQIEPPPNMQHPNNAQTTSLRLLGVFAQPLLMSYG